MRIEESQGPNGGQNGHAQPAKSGPTAEQILGEIRDYCRQTQTAESTFGRLVVNDGKLVSRLRDGARITTGTLDKVRAYLNEHRPAPSNVNGSPATAKVVSRVSTRNGSSPEMGLTMVTGGTAPAKARSLPDRERKATAAIDTRWKALVTAQTTTSRMITIA